MNLLEADDWIRVTLGTVLSFITIFIISRLQGKKTISQMQLIDYVVGITIGSIAAQMCVDDTIPFYYFILAMSIFVILDLLVGFLERKANFLKYTLRGKPQVLIEDGKINVEELKKSKLDVNELLSLCRQKNFFDINDIAFAVFETNGELSILPKANMTPVVVEDINVVKPKPSLSSDVIIDGKIIYACLKEMGKDKDWLISKLGIKNEKEISKYMLVSYDENEDKMYCHLMENKKQKEDKKS